MVYFIKAKREIRAAILKILERETEFKYDILVAGLKLETGLTSHFIREIIDDMKMVRQIFVYNGFIALKDHGVDRK